MRQLTFLLKDEDDQLTYRLSLSFRDNFVQIHGNMHILDNDLDSLVGILDGLMIGYATHAIKMVQD